MRGRPPAACVRRTPPITARMRSGILTARRSSLFPRSTPGDKK
ncbi:conserved hypothetical protein [Burkholderia pseudomallei 406e]|nr:conserved hypothetical protein [Burkholderia pseudomallei 1106a]ACQ97434.1 conserved hypothetical protein [Burkholderia pseudomallei MSHR346]AFR16207.1 hypothetical protein BPC006_I2337 [Burkholderia pseudomallei BPC006]EDO84259.1 conserved hypothetical protein [Burkholderia pseudomallei 406e]EDO92470.1 conserved hypothetical protein [Burkholderia pseudomallei Pasteur 52237]EDS87517.1 conserved hypothetical protein [Burkholderia pseudomallei S13]EEC35302.1 conserved hypothetical protein [B